MSYPGAGFTVGSEGCLSSSVRTTPRSSRALASQVDPHQVVGDVPRPVARIMDELRGAASVGRARSRASTACAGCYCVRTLGSIFCAGARGSLRQLSTRTLVCASHTHCARMARACELRGALWAARLRADDARSNRRHAAMLMKSARELVRRLALIDEPISCD